MTNEIPLRNKYKEIIGYTKVSEEDYIHLSQFKFYKTNDGYVKSSKLSYLSIYIIKSLMEKDIPINYIVDHINNDKLDNRRNNLRVLSLADNIRNREKNKNSTSKYYGVCKSIKNNKYCTSICINGKNYRSYYEHEIHAAHAYNLLIKKYNIDGAKFNEIDIELIKNFIEYEKKEKELPKGVCLRNKKYTVTFNNKYIGVYNTKEEAIKIRTELEDKEKNDIYVKLMSTPKAFNKNGDCVLNIENYEYIIDESKFYDLIQYKWYILGDKIVAKINGKVQILSRYIMNYSGQNIVDHINRNPFDNRESNLRVVTIKQNSQNRSSSKNSTSKYIGVSFDSETGKWKSTIMVNYKSINLGRFNNEIDAAKTRDIATKKYFGEFGNLNFPDSN